MSVAASILLALGVALGAIGAHALRGSLSAETLAVFEKAVFYHITMSLGVLALSIYRAVQPGSSVVLFFSALMLTIGIVLFSGSLYLYTVSGIRWLAMITPVGGILLILGWFAAGYGFLRS